MRTILLKFCLGRHLETKQIRHNNKDNTMTGGTPLPFIVGPPESSNSVNYKSKEVINIALTNTGH